MILYSLQNGHFNKYNLFSGFVKKCSNFLDFPRQKENKYVRFVLSSRRSVSKSENMNFTVRQMKFR